MLRRPFESALAAMVGMVNHAPGAALPKRHVECRQHQFGAQMSFHRPGGFRFSFSAASAALIGGLACRDKRFIERFRLLRPDGVLLR